MTFKQKMKQFYKFQYYLKPQMEDVQKMENDMVSNLYFCNISFVVICLKMTVGFIQAGRFL